MTERIKPMPGDIVQHLYKIPSYVLKSEKGILALRNVFDPHTGMKPDIGLLSIVISNVKIANIHTIRCVYVLSSNGHGWFPDDELTNDVA